MADFHSELPIPIPVTDKVWGSCHEWRIKNCSDNEYICVECGSECTGAKNMSSQGSCTIRIIPRSWLPSKHPSYRHKGTILRRASDVKIGENDDR